MNQAINGFQEGVLSVWLEAGEGRPPVPARPQRALLRQGRGHPGCRRTRNKVFLTKRLREKTSISYTVKRNL